MRRDRKLLHKPFLEATLKAARYPKALTFSVKNVGRGAALSCRAKCEDNKGTEWLLNGNIPPIGSSESLDLEFVLSLEDYKISGETIRLEMEYSDVFGKVYKKTIAELDTNVVIMNS
jgi:hypothetical protein